MNDARVRGTVSSGNAVFIGASRYRRHSYGSNHPLGIPRVSLTIDLINAYGALADDEYVVSRKASVPELQWFHTADYVSAMQRCEATGKVKNEFRKRHNIGNFENPYFTGFFTTPATATGGSIQGAEALLAGRIAFNPAGGMHHARPDQARGFCFFNDPVLAILRLRREGFRVLYLDIDAHHGDGVESAFEEDPDVVTVSLHMDTEYAYPFQGGRLEDTGAARNAVNVPLPAGINDTEYWAAFETVWPIAAHRFGPDAVVLQAGTDMLFADPLGKFQVSTQLFLDVIASVLAHSPRHPDGTPKLLVLGGGGYHPLMLARCWAGVWAVLSGRTLPRSIPVGGRRLLEEVEWDLDEDEPYYEDLFRERLDRDRGGPVGAEVRRRLDRLRRIHRL